MSDSGVLNLRKIQIENILVNLSGVTPGIRLCLVVHTDGTTVASMHPDGRNNMDVSQYAAMVVTTLTITKRWASMSSQGDLQELITMGTNGYSQIWFIDEDNALACLCDKGINIGALGVHMKIASQQLREIIEQF